VLALVLLMPVIGTTVYTTYRSDGRASRVAADNANASAFRALTEEMKDYASDTVCLTRYPYEQWKKYGTWFCSINRDDNPTLLLLGTSFANHHYAGFVRNQTLGRQTVLSLGVCDVAEPASTESDYERDPTGPCFGANK